MVQRGAAIRLAARGMGRFGSDPFSETRPDLACSAYCSTVVPALLGVPVESPADCVRISLPDPPPRLPYVLPRTCDRRSLRQQQIKIPDSLAVDRRFFVGPSVSVVKRRNTRTTTV